MSVPKASNEAERLKALHRYGILDSPPEGEFDDLTRLIASICNTPIAVITFIDDGRVWFKSQVGLSVGEIPRETSICGYTMLQPGMMVVPDLAADQRFATNPLVCSGGRWRFYAGSTLETQDGFALGTLCVIDTIPRELTVQQREALTILGRQVVTQLELRRHSRDAEAAAQALREADQRKDRFLIMLAHELRNPLAPISNALALWAQVDNDRAKMENLRALMERQVTQMTRLIDDLLDLSRIASGKITLRKQRTDLNSEIMRAVEALRPAIEAQHHRLTVGAPDAPMVMEADPGRLVQVFSNLLNNAAKFTAPGGQLQIVVEREAEWATVKVRDNGPGIPEHMLESIFVEFTQVDDSLERSHGGLGIGLTLVKVFVELHGGSVEARSEGPGKGCEFVVRLPVLPEGTLQAAADPPQQDSRHTTAQVPRRVLIVDDVEAAATTLGRALQSLGHEIRVAHDGPKAIAIARAYQPGVIFLDLAMPGMSGYAVARLLRAQPGLDGIVLVAVTGYGRDEDRRQTAEAGFDYHLVKPVSMELIQSLLEALPQRGVGSDAGHGVGPHAGESSRPPTGPR